MKKYIVIFVLVISVMALSACNGVGKTAPTPLPTLVLDQGSSTSQPSSQGSGGAVAASGTVTSAQEAQMAFAAMGTVQVVHVAVGEAVKTGQALMSLDATQAKVAVTQAEANLAAAQASYDLAAGSVTAQSEANIASARLALMQAQNELSDLEQNAPLITAQAQSALASAQKALDDAQRERTNLNYPRADQTTIDGAKAAYDLKEDELKKARENYNNVSGLAADNPERAKALLDLTEAQKARDKALITLNWYQGKNSQKDLAEADAALALAQAQLAAAERKLAEVKDGPSAKDLALVKEKVTSAQALLDLANAQSAQKQLDLAQAQLDAARAGLELAKTQLANSTLSASFDGVIASIRIHPGEWVMAGQPVLVLADLTHLRIETTDLSEKDVSKVEIDQPVTIFIKAINKDVTGRVVEISPLADTLGGDVVYKTVIDLDETPPGLLLGMSAEVQFEAAP